jgi:hypothetical protein
MNNDEKDLPKAKRRASAEEQFVFEFLNQRLESKADVHLDSS